MASAEDVRRLALALPQVVDATKGADAVRCEVTGGKGLAWTYYRRVQSARGSPIRPWWRSAAPSSGRRC